MTPTLQLVLALGIIILAAKSMGYVSVRLGQPAVLGELLAGLVLGPTMLDFFHLPIFSDKHLTEVILELGELGVIFLMFIAGLEVDLQAMLRAGKVSTLVGTLGVFTPIALAIPAGMLFGYDLSNSIFIGIILAATSVSISAQTLLELGRLRSREGTVLLGAAVIDDVIVIIILSLFLAVSDAGTDLVQVGAIFAREILFIGVAVFIGAKLLPRLADWVSDLPISEGVMALVLCVTLFYAWSAEQLGAIAAITGAFLAGVFFARTSQRHAIERGMHTLAYAFFVPIFFISIGLQANARDLRVEELWLTGAIIVVAIISKIVGCGLGAWLGKLSARQGLRVGIGMISRGEVGLIVAGIGLASQTITDSVYSGVVVMVLVTTLITPILLRWAFAPAEVTDG
ncbi:MAG: cation:proton antiporter [Chloroflexi bacterium]|nr:cation:proton antiporter [Chloroflexota bacterium]